MLVSRHGRASMALSHCIPLLNFLPKRPGTAGPTAAIELGYRSPGVPRLPLPEQIHLSLYQSAPAEGTAPGDPLAIEFGYRSTQRTT